LDSEGIINYMRMYPWMLIYRSKFSV